MKGQIAIEDYESGNTKHNWDIKKVKSAHKTLAEYNYKKKELQKGYANRTLYI